MRDGRIGAAGSLAQVLLSTICARPIHCRDQPAGDRIARGFHIPPDDAPVFIVLQTRRVDLRCAVVQFVSTCWSSDGLCPRGTPSLLSSQAFNDTTAMRRCDTRRIMVVNLQYDCDPNTDSTLARTPSLFNNGSVPVVDYGELEP